MADVNMTDAPAPKAKAAKAGASTEGDKKRFEVKKVSCSKLPAQQQLLTPW